ncbi:hypothetical protein SCALM49S_09771 [Streptomyces californicus]
MYSRSPQVSQRSRSYASAGSGSISPLVQFASRSSSARCWPGSYGKASRTCRMMAGCRSASTLWGKEPGWSPRSTGADGVSGMRLTVARGRRVPAGPVGAVGHPGRFVPPGDRQTGASSRSRRAARLR